MKKRGREICFMLIGISAGLLIAVAALFILRSAGAPPVSPNISNLANTLPAAEVSLSRTPQLIESAYSVASAIADRDYAALAAWAHPEEGVMFVPYSTVDKTRNLVFKPEQIKKFTEEKTELVWGIYDGSGEPIIKTPTGFCEEFFSDHDFTQAPVIGVNTIVKSGNSLENVAEEFPDAEFVDLHYPGFDAGVQGMDWRTLRLVFLPYDGGLKLAAVIHCCWTV